MGGKSAQRTNRMPRDSTTANIPPSILRKYDKVMLGLEVPYIFLTAKQVKFMQCLCIHDKFKEVYIKALERMNSVYVLRGFEVTRIYADRVFEPCQSELA